MHKFFTCDKIGHERKGDTRAKKGTRAQKRRHARKKGDTRAKKGTRAQKRGHAPKKGHTCQKRDTRAQNKYPAHL